MTNDQSKVTDIRVEVGGVPLAQGTIRQSSPAPPSSPVDEAAVVAVRIFVAHHMLVNAVLDEDKAARIITNVYAPQRIHLVQADRDSEALAHSIEVRDGLLTRLTAERAVRDKLVDVLSACKGAVPQNFNGFRKCITDVIAEAEKLEDGDE